MKTIAEIRRDLRLMSKKLRQNRIDPVLTIDGLGASGKGMVASKLAADLKWNLLDTGLYYRCCAFGFAENGFRNVPELVHHFEMEGFPFEMCRQAPWLSPDVFFKGVNITTQVRQENVAYKAATLAQDSRLRAYLNALFKSLPSSPGLVVDGRDAGSNIFPESTLKFFFYADLEVRSKRREFADVCFNSSMAALEKRDQLDLNRATAPCRPGEETIIVNNTGLSELQTYFVVVDVLLERFAGS